MDKETRAHNRVLAEYQRRMQDILDRYSHDMSRLARAVQADPDRPFAFSDHPPLKDRHAAMLAEMRSLMVSQVEDAVRQEWGRADRKNDALAVSVIGSEEGAAALGYIRRNTDALEAFMKRKTAGMDLSGRVWDITGQFDTQVQDAIDTALLDGKSADELSREVRNLLHNPDALFRRVRDNRGLLHLSRNAKAYHPGQGVYRSAYMNARRMAATEINMAYRTADHLRVQQMDFVVGIEVHLSGNHNCKGVPPGQFVDICDELQGRYPKDFKFTGWHPFCRCYATTVLKSRDEMRSGTKDSANEVNDVPQGFKDWVDRNQERIAHAKQLPYFLRDNGAVENGVWQINSTVTTTGQSTSLLEKAAKRHTSRTQEEEKKIRDMWQSRKDAYSALETIEAEFGDDTVFEMADFGQYYGKYKDLREELASFIIKKTTEYKSLKTNDKTYLLQVDMVVDELSKKNLSFAANGLAKLRSMFTKKTGVKTTFTPAMKNATTGDKPHHALLKKYKDNVEVDKTFMEIEKSVKNAERWFRNGQLKLDTTTNKLDNGSTNMHGGIKLSPGRRKKVLSALGKIGSGSSSTITKAEADAMATFWHEITHNRHVGADSRWMLSGPAKDTATRYMEFANEFVARHTLDEFYSRLGCKNPFPEFTMSRSSTDYNTMVTRYDWVIDTLKLDRGKIVESVKNALFNKDYLGQFKRLANGLIDGGIMKINGNLTSDDIGIIVEMCKEGKTKKQILDKMEKLGLIPTR